MSDGELLLVTGALLAAGLAAALVADRVRLPGLLLFLGVGMLLGTDGTGLIDFDDVELARTVGIVALVLILFEGGLVAGWSEVRPVLVPAVALATVATLLTAIVGGLAAAWLFDLSILQGMLLGSIVAATDGAAIFSLLRGSTLKRRLARTLEGEAGLNDPVAILLVLGFIDWIQKPDYGIADMAILFVEELAIGLAVGLALGRGTVWALARMRLGSAGLYPVASIAAGALAFGVADALHGSGFLSVYLVGLAIGSSSGQGKSTIVTFHQGLAWVAQLSLFFVLGLLVFPSRLDEVAVEGTVLAVLSCALARPLAVQVATIRQGYSSADKLVLGWAGLRGAVPVVLATFPVLAGVPGSERFFDIVFFAVLVSTLLQGTTFERVAARLGATTLTAAVPAPLLEAETIRRLGAEVVEFPVGDRDAVVGQRVRDLLMPRTALLNVVVRGDQAIPPRGSTRVHAGDRLHVLVRQEAAVEFGALLERWRTGPIGPPPRAPRTPRSTPSITSVRPWQERDGDPARPDEVAGQAVITRLRTRRDVPGALVELEDGRYAVTGPLLLLGSPGAVRDAAQRRLRLAKGDEEASWYREVIGAVSAAR